MALRVAQRYANISKWVVTLFLITIVWCVGEYGVDWKSKTDVVTLLVVIAVLAFCVTYWNWKRKHKAS